MSIDLPEPIAAYIAAENAHDVEGLHRYFTADAVVRDEDQFIVGLTAITQGKIASRQKYQHTVAPLAVAHQDGKTVVTNRVSGNFPGSPVDLRFIFGLEGNKITSLEIF